MSLNPKLRRKVQQQYNLAEYQRKLLVTELYRLIDDLEHQPVIRSRSPVPFGTLERTIQSGLDGIEKNFIQKIWWKLARLRNR